MMATLKASLLAAALGLAAGQSASPPVEATSFPAGDGASQNCALNTQTSSDASSCAPLTGSGSGWRFGRATFYGGPESYLSNFPDRGSPPEYGFGTTVYGSCGYLSQTGNQGLTIADVPVANNLVAALSNVAVDYPGSCGRCYEVRCQTGAVIANYTGPASSPTSEVTLSTISQGYQPARNVSQVRDEYGRVTPANPLMAENIVYTSCWNDTLGLTTADKSIYVEVTDNCPCLQVNATTGLIYGVNQDCCGNVEHMDLSFYAFERLAHPVQGIMNTEFRPVDCATKAPRTFLPGFINNTLYGDRVEAGWGWNPYLANNRQFAIAGAGVGGSNATCVDLMPQGGVTFNCRDCNVTGYRPFASTTNNVFSFYIKQTSATNLGGTSTTAPTAIPSLQLGLGNNAAQYYCQSQQTTALTKGATANGYTRLSAPLSSFGTCDLTRVTDIGFQNLGSSSVQFCLDNIMLGAAGSGSS